jgi:hypothetical protein
MTDEPRKPVKLEFLPSEYTQVIFVVHGGGGITRFIARIITPPAKLLIGMCAWLHRTALRLRGR